MNIKTPEQAKAIKKRANRIAKAIKKRANRIAKSRTKRLNKRRLDADERKFLNEFKEVWE